MRIGGSMQASVIIGGGPGGMGPLLWAAQTGNLDAWLRQGVSLVDRQSCLGGTLGRYAINSDSLGAAYLECLEAPLAIEPLRRLLADPVAREMEQYRNGFPPLELVDRFMRRVGDVLARVIRSHKSSDIRPRTMATALHIRHDGNLVVNLRDARGRNSSIAARSAVLAVGGRQRWADQLWQDLRPGLRLADCRLRHMLPSDRLLTAEGLNEIQQALADAGGRKIVILGGSHSAYSAAWALTNLIDRGQIAERQILILSRRRPPIFYPDAAAAIADGYPVGPDDICPRTHRVHRLGGLRGNGRDIWRQLTGRPATTPDPRASMLMLQDLPVADLRRLLEEAAVVIPAFGYCAATIPVYDIRGHQLRLQADLGLAAVDGKSRLLLEDGAALPNVFSLGLGSGYRPDGTMGGEASFNGQANSLWLYQNDIGALVYRGIQDVLEQLARQPHRPGTLAPQMAPA